VTEVPVQCSAVQCRSKPPRTEPRSKRPIARPDQTRLASPHDFRHRNWVWGGLRCSNATTPRPAGLDHPWPAIHCTVLYTPNQNQIPKAHTHNTHQQAPGYATYSSGTLELAPNRTCPPAPSLSPRGPGYRLLCFTYLHARRLLTLVRSTLRLL
jgi:hypothetical protein